MAADTLTRCLICRLRVRNWAVSVKHGGRRVSAEDSASGLCGPGKGGWCYEAGYGFGAEDTFYYGRDTESTLLWDNWVTLGFKDKHFSFVL